jgi:hypothetical protein
MNYLDRLPRELRFLIAEFVPSKPDRNLPYLNEFKSVVTNWYNRTRVCGDVPVYRNYTELYLHGITSYETQFIKYGFFEYAKEILYYKMKMCPFTKQIKMIPFRNPLS